MVISSRFAHELTIHGVPGWVEGQVKLHSYTRPWVWNVLYPGGEPDIRHGKERQGRMENSLKWNSRDCCPARPCGALESGGSWQPWPCQSLAWHTQWDMSHSLHQVSSLSISVKRGKSDRQIAPRNQPCVCIFSVMKRWNFVSSCHEFVPWVWSKRQISLVAPGLADHLDLKHDIDNFKLLTCRPDNDSQLQSINHHC